jgi:hypothetical protein
MSTTHVISLSTAIAMTSRFRNNKNTILSSSYQNQDVIPNCETFDKESIETVLNQEGCVAFRVYYGMDENLKIHAILVGVNGNGADILPVESSLLEEEPEGVILEEGQRCPPYCPPTSPLNDD